MEAQAIFDELKTAIERRHCVRMLADDMWRAVCPLSLGYKGEKLKVLTFQYSGDSASGIATDGGWRCFALDEISWVRINDDPWHSGHNAVAKLEASLDTVICGMGAAVRTYDHLKQR